MIIMTASYIDDDYGHHFLARENAKSARFHVPKNGTSSAPIYERSPKTSRNTPQNGWADIWVMRLHFQASIKPIFENHVLSAVSGPFHPLYETKISNRWLSVVYGSITLKFFSWALGTISHQWFNRGNKIQKKVFLGHPSLHTNLQVPPT